MKIELNQKLDTDQLLDLENHVLEVAEEAYMTEEPRPDLDQFAVRGSLEVKSEELAKAIVDFISNNIKRVIVWTDGKKVVDKFGSSPLDIEGEEDRRHESTPAKLVDQLLSEDCGKFIVKGWKEGKVGGYDSVEAAIEDYKEWSGGISPIDDGLAVIPC